MFFWKSNKKDLEKALSDIKAIKAENTLLKKELSSIQIMTRGNIPVSTTTKKQDASNYIQECLDSGISIPESLTGEYYYYTKQSVLRGCVNLAGRTFKTDKNTTFLLCRGQKLRLLGFPLIDLSEVKEPNAVVIKMQHFSEHIIAPIIEATIHGDPLKNKQGIGFTGLEFDKLTPFETDYHAGNYQKAEIHNGTFRLYTRYLNIGFKSDKTGGGGANCHELVHIVDQGSKQALYLKDTGGIKEINIWSQPMYNLKEEEKDIPYIYLASDRNNLIYDADVKNGSKIESSDDNKYWTHSTVIENLGDNNTLNKLMAYGKFNKIKGLDKFELK